MKKLRLEIDSLVVESFDVSDDASAGRGTVQGRETAVDEPCGQSHRVECAPSYEEPCWWTGDPMLDCYAPSEGAPCTDYRC